MSKIDTIITLLKAQTLLALPTHETLLDPSFEGREDELRFERSFGITIGPASIENVYGTDIAFTRQFTVTIIRANYSINTLTSNREAVEIALVEDQLLVIKQLLSITKSGASHPYIQKINIVSDNGVEPLIPENRKFLTVRSTFEISYHEISS